MAIGDDTETLEKEKCYSQIWKLREYEMQDFPSDNLLNDEKEKSHDSQSKKLMEDETDEKRTPEQQKVRRLCRMKWVIMVAVCAIILLITVEIIIKYTSIARTVSECGTPPNVNNSRYLKTGNTPGDVSVYHCMDGYLGIGDEEIFCQDDGQWSKSVFVCMEECSNPPDVINSLSIVSGVKASYFCKDGFHPVGETTIECQDGNWSQIKFSCSKYCGLPPEVQFSARQINGNVSGSVTFYQCLDGYVPVGETNVVCSKHGRWSNVNLSCLKDCPKPPYVLNSTGNKSVNKSGVFASYECHIGFYQVGNSSIVCQDGKWSTINFDCSKYCGKPRDIPFSTHQIHGITSGAKTVYDCLNGYASVGEPNTVCNSNGEWSPMKFSCLKDCGVPPTVPFARPRYTSTYLGSNVNYHCTYGYDSSGYSAIRCQSDGEWTKSNFECKPTDCGGPPTKPFARPRYTSTHFGSKVNYHCIDGYISRGNSMIRCQSDGKWTMGNFECKPTECGGPPIIQFAKPRYTSTYFGSKINYHCTHGYISSGYSTITCRSDGKWTKSNFECKPAAKPSLPNNNSRQQVHTNGGNRVFLSIRNLTLFAVFWTFVNI